MLSFFVMKKDDEMDGNQLFTVLDFNIIIKNKRSGGMVNIINIQKYSLHDGDGIRTTIFFKGCPLRCLWCHNPESQHFERELMLDYEKCVGCGYCRKVCEHHAIQMKEGKIETDLLKCQLCERCIDYCVDNNRQIVGRSYTVEELFAIIEKDRIFYEESGGGVTLSGGEVMMQDMVYIKKLCQKLKQHDYHIAIDTCGYAPREHFSLILPYVDVFLYDIKAMDDTIHQNYTGKSNRLILENLVYLAQQHANINIRIPVIEHVNAMEEEMEKMIAFVREKIGIVKVNLLPYHSTGSSKYARLQRDYEGKDLCAPSKEGMETIKKLWMENGFVDVNIGG